MAATSHKPQVLPPYDKLMLSRRSIIETINDQLKNISQIEHSRHRSVNNFFVNVMAGLIAYSLRPSKPSVSLDPSAYRALLAMTKMLPGIMKAGALGQIAKMGKSQLGGLLNIGKRNK